MSLRLVEGQLDYLAEHGWDVHVGAGSARYSPNVRDSAFTLHPLPLSRSIRPIRDTSAFLSLLRLCRRLRPSVVHASTPKAGLLGTLAAWVMRVPVRVYVVRGLRFETAAGLARPLMLCAEWITCRCATHVVCVSPSVRHVLVSSRLAPEGKAHVLARGSGNGVSLDWFMDEHSRARLRALTRRDLGIADNAFVIGFVGRITPDKGFCELYEAWRTVRRRHPRAHLIVVGPVEAGDSAIRRAVALLRSDPRAHLTGTEWNPVRYYAAMDILCLPSRREGLPNVVLEAAAMHVPSVVTAATGCTDAVIPNVTGVIVHSGSPDALAHAIAGYLVDGDKRKAHGRAACERAVSDFSQQRVWSALSEFLTAAAASVAWPRRRTYQPAEKRSAT